MDLYKLKLDKFNNILIKNFPKKYSLGIDSVNEDELIDVIIYYIDEFDDVQKFVSLCETVNLNKENRVIYVYEKGRKDKVNRDAIYEPFKTKEYKNFKMKAPMLCSLSDKLSAFVQQKIL
ncbi:MAG: hypothetical protein ACPKM0_01910 [Pleomorphochaeta sp.]